jgi:hypothetical protein
MVKPMPPDAAPERSPQDIVMNAILLAETHDANQARRIADTLVNRGMVIAEDKGNTPFGIMTRKGSYEGYKNDRYQKIMAGIENMPPGDQKAYREVFDAFQDQLRKRAAFGDAADLTGGATNIGNGPFWLRDMNAQPQNFQYKGSYGDQHYYRENVEVTRRRR